jgi:3-methyl-2-oxobutanoate hydroxymethyltransferase
MSVATDQAAARKPLTLATIAAKYGRQEPLVMVTAYDYPGARVCELAGVDLVLVGDSGAQMELGYPSTTVVPLQEMLSMTAAVHRGLKTPLLVGDLPFGSYEQSDAQAVATAVRFVKEAGADAVKLERGNELSAARARAIVQAGVPVVGHVGLTPQTATALGGLRTQGRTSDRAAEIAAEALALQRAGCFMIVFEAIPAAVTELLMPLMEIPVIGIGAGPATDGQVLVFHDLLGIREGTNARFVKTYAQLLGPMRDGVAAYAEDVRARRFPTAEHCYSVADSELAELRTRLADLSIK